MNVRIDKKLYDQIVKFQKEYEPDLSITKVTNRLLRAALAAANNK